jgi:hypothetical protein
MRCRVKGSALVGVKYSKSRARASFDGLQSCASVWACPICSAKISEHRRAELVQLVAAHRAAGGYVVLATRTFPHSRRDDLADLLSRLAIAENKFKSGKPWSRLVARHGIVGTVRALEATYGSNGWHPHIHELVFIAPGRSCDLLALQADLYTRWASAAVRAGFPLPSLAHGVDVRDGTYAARYASKWGIESELTKAHAKRGKAGSLSPFDLLRIALATDDRSAARTASALFATYATAFKGKRQLVYSPGLRARYLAKAELTDQEAAEGTEPDAVLLGRLEPSHWKAILKANLRGSLLEAINASLGDWSAIDEVLGAALAFTPTPNP